MKELSIEQKAKAYDNIIEKASRMHSENCEACQICIEELIPELRESEDERIRKDLINYLKSVLSNKKYGDKFIEDWIAWLEKRGEQEPADKVEPSFDEAQGTPIIKQEENKPNDKVKPKFHEGDWVVYDNRVYQVVELPKEGYINLGLRRNGKIEFAPSTYCRHWTIQDVKNGDVLYENDTKTILIFKSQTCGWIKVYCDFWINKNKFTGTDPADYGRVSEMNLKPATKEQRDLLFQMMKEAGYEWDAEKKELKKIEFNPDALIEESYQQQADNIINMVTENPAWSEDDELMLGKCIDAASGYYSPEDKQSMKDWLNSIKDRVQPQPKQEWSEEDRYNLSDIEAMIHTMKGDGLNADRLIDWLTSLKPQSQ
jgi:hypothetical protein